MHDNIRREIETTIDVIKRFPEIEKIILFGSLATETGHNDSDIDLLLVRNNNWQSKRALLKKIRNILPSQTFPLDLVLMNDDEVSELLASPNSVVSEAINHGKILYER